MLRDMEPRPAPRDSEEMRLVSTGGFREDASTGNCEQASHPEAEEGAGGCGGPWGEGSGRTRGGAEGGHGEGVREDMGEGRTWGVEGRGRTWKDIGAGLKKDIEGHGGGLVEGHGGGVAGGWGRGGGSSVGDRVRLQTTWAH